MERLLQEVGGVLRLAAVACEALLRLQTTTLSGFGMFFIALCGWGHWELLHAVVLSMRGVQPTMPLHFLLSFPGHLRYIEHVVLLFGPCVAAGLYCFPPVQEDPRWTFTPSSIR